MQFTLKESAATFGRGGAPLVRKANWSLLFISILDWGEQWTAIFVPTPCTFSRSLQLGASYSNFVFEKMDRKTWSLGFGFGSLQHWNLGFSTPHVAIPRGMSTHPCQKLAKVVQAGSKISSFLGVHAKSWLPRRMDSTPTVGKDDPLGITITISITITTITITITNNDKYYTTTERP